MSGRFLVFIVAFQSERHLAGVLARVPPELISNPSVEFLIIDDGSSDNGVLVGRQWVEKTRATNVTILRNPANQGYGGNQKLGYRLALDAGFDFVILLHGDGQYAPELLGEFIRIRRDTGADVVLGSRMMDLRSARRGGMPWYKMAGNRALTIFQNSLTKRTLSEYHSGYRGYSANFLRRVPFEINSNGFHFDTEILLQAFHVGAKIEEFGIPTHYGSAVCRVNGLQYARDVIRATLRFRMHNWGMLCDQKYRLDAPLAHDEQRFMRYSSRVIALAAVHEHRPKTILHIGCHPGFFARQCRSMGAHVVGLDREEPIAGSVDEFRHYSPEEDPTPTDAFDYDVILLLDALERMAEPERFLVALRNRSTLRSADQRLPVVILSVANIAFAAMRLNLLLGRFSYAQRGILDIRNKRLFTLKNLRTTLRECGYVVGRVRPAAVPFLAVMGGPVARILEAGSRLLARCWPSLFAFQFVVECRPLPGVRQLLETAERHGRVSPGLSGVLQTAVEGVEEPARG